MTTYKGINGFAVQSVASDPSPLDEGQVWYNNATYAFKLASVTTAGSWSSGGSMNAARSDSAGFGTQTAGLVAGGYSGSPTNGEGITELYNGTSWTTSGNMGTARELFGRASNAPSATALAFGGSPSNTATELFTGPSTTLNYKTLTTS